MKTAQIRIHEVLPRLLKERGLTAKKLSQLSGVPASTLSTWLLPNSRPRNLDHLLKVSEVLGVSLDLLLLNESRGTKDLSSKQGEVVLSGVFKLHLEKIDSEQGED